VVVAVAGVQVAAEAAGDLILGPVAELVAAVSGWGLQVGQELLAVVVKVAQGAWRPGWGGV
jgi:hypothetical protein